MKRALIACEFSGVVRRAFRAKGWDAYSCDLLPSEDDSPHHIIGDFRSVNQESWDFVGYHYECKLMANSGVQWLFNIPANPKPGNLYGAARMAALREAAEIFNLTIRDPRPGYAENSIMHCHAKELIDRPQDQVIQPWHFGEPRFKATCLWFRGGIKPLQDTNRLTPPKAGTELHKEWSAVHRASPGPNRWKERSRTLPGIAQAMADQWTK